MNEELRTLTVKGTAKLIRLLVVGSACGGRAGLVDLGHGGSDKSPTCQEVATQILVQYIKPKDSVAFQDQKDRKDGIGRYGSDGGNGQGGGSGQGSGHAGQVGNGQDSSSGVHHHPGPKGGSNATHVSNTSGVPQTYRASRADHTGNYTSATASGLTADMSRLNIGAGSIPRSARQQAKPSGGAGVKGSKSDSRVTPRR
jgi:hypothetical protein